MRRYSVMFGLVMGIGMLGMWTAFLLGGQVEEIRTAPTALAFHLVAEMLTAAALATGAVGLALQRRWAPGLYLFALGLFAYTGIVSPGYFAQRGDWAFVAMFATFLAAAVPAALGVMRPSQRHQPAT